MDTPGHAPEADGPKYKLSSFLFGNVDKQGQIEDYRNDEDLQSINNIDQCCVKEVEETALKVISSNEQPEPSVEEPAPIISELPPTRDYYDEIETVPEGAVEEAMRGMKPDADLPCKSSFDDSEDYDSPEPVVSCQAVTITTTSTPSETGAYATGDGKMKSEYHDATALPPSTKESTEWTTTTTTASLSHAVTESLTVVTGTIPWGNVGGEQVGLPHGKGVSIMPPPLHPAPLAVSRQIKGSKHPDFSSPSTLPGGASELTETQSLSSATTLDPSLSNTPLGSLIPLEYANVDIKDLFPTYDPNRTPRWSCLFKLPHSLGVYREFIERAAYVNSLVAQREAKYANRTHLIYDNVLDLGVIPLPEEIVEQDDVTELNSPAPPGTDCLAGSVNSWWRLAYKAAFDKMNGHTRQRRSELDSAGQTGGTEARSIEEGKRGGGGGTAATVAGRRSITDGQTMLDGKNGEAQANRAHTMSDEELCSGWRMGPAKYWYDQLGIPLDADISTWTEWRRPTSSNVIPTTTSVSTTSGAAETNAVKASSTETAAPEPGESRHSSEENTPVNGSCDGESREDRKPPVMEYPSIRKPLNGTKTSTIGHNYPEQTTVYPYQLINWEDDIIYDPNLSASKISASAKMNAAYAGWIPSQHCRTMAAFQDAYQGKFPFIVGSKALNGLSSANAVMEILTGSTKRPPPPTSQTNTPYSIFPVENQSILNNSWAYDIVYDSDLPVNQLPPPFLFTLDYNDETCLMESVDDEQIAAAIATARGFRNQHIQQQQLQQNSQSQQAQSSRQSSSNNLRSALGIDATGASGTTGDRSNAPNTDDNWTGLNADASTVASKSNMPSARASLQVSFGLASTRGMLTGALAKAEHGAEKVKMILGKHGLLAEDDWQTDTDKFPDLSSSAAGATVPAGSTATDAIASGEAGVLASAAAAVSGIPPKDPLNLSNDEYYALRSGALGMGGLARCGPLQHSTPAVELWPPFFPTYMSPLRLRQFHRVPLKKYLRGPMAQYNVPFQVVNLVRTIQRKAREREEEKTVTGGGDIFFMRTPADLSGADGDVVLFELSEESPPLMAQVGMASRVINYHRPLNPRDRSLSPAPNAVGEPPDLPYGSLVYVSATDSPFLGVIRPRGCLQTLENNMFRAPIYPHSMPSTDFLVIRGRNGISIRRVNDLFTVGQQVPLMEVPGPNSKRANNFVRDFLQAFILRLFLCSTDEPKRIKIEEIRKAFPNHSESSVRKRLKVCADFRRTGSDASWWVLRSDYRLPSEEEVRYLVSPEDCCAHYSMLAAELRLKDAGYGEKSLFVLDENQEDEDEKEGQPKMEDEVRAAPWNTTRAYLASQRGGCFLELHGAADPTGCGEAFSYSKTSAKPGALFRQAGGEVARGLLKGKRTVTGTDADLRKLHLREARGLLRSFGISEADLKSFKRWEIIDMVRFTSTERAKQGEEESSSKFARGNRLSVDEQVRCYREECQRIFDLQNRVLSNKELLSSDEEVSSEEEEDEMTAGTEGAGRVGSAATGGAGAVATGGAVGGTIGGVRLSSLPSNAPGVASGRQLSGFSRREESEDRLKRALESGEPLVGSKRPRKTNPAGLPSKDTTEATAVPTTGPASSTTTLPSLAPSAVYDAGAGAAGAILDLTAPYPAASRKLLRIIRTYSEDGQQYTRTEHVPWSPVVEIYLKIRQTRDDDFIHNFVDSDDQIREQQRKEKRRLQDQLRRLRKQQALMRERGHVGSGSASQQSQRPTPMASDPNRRRRHKPLTSALVKMRCGACGQTGHMRTNKECPMYGRGEAVADGRRVGAIGAHPTTGSGTTHRSSSSAMRAGGTRRHAPGTSSSHRSDSTSLRATDGSDPIAAAHALAARPVSELLAEQEEQEEQLHADQTSANIAAMGEASLDDMSSTGGGGAMERSDKFDSHREDSNDRVTQFGENDMTVEGTKLKLHSGLTRYIHEQNRRNLKLKIRRQLLDRLNAAAAVVQSSSHAARRGLAGRPATGTTRGGRRGGVGATEDEFPTGLKHRGNRRRIDPRVALNHIFEGIYKGLTQISGSKIFMHPVKEKDFPNYYSQITNPMDLSQIRMKINENAYATREEFLSDIRLIYNNSLNFNGRYSSYTETAMKMCSHVMEQFCSKELKLMRLESLVNPLLDENDLVGLNFLLQQAIEAMRSVEKSRAFHTPVDKRRYPNYYKLIVNPMDLSLLEKMVKENRFRSREEFFRQAELIYDNCVTFNGLESPLTDIARRLLEGGRARLEQDAETLDTIEGNIRRHMPPPPTVDESILSESGAASNVTKPLSQSRRPTGGGGIKRRPTRTQSSHRPPKLPRLSEEAPDASFDLQTDVDDGTEMPVRHPTPAATASNVPGTSRDSSARTLRRRSTGAWYGVDLEYNDDDDEGTDAEVHEDDDDDDDENRVTAAEDEPDDHDDKPLDDDDLDDEIDDPEDLEADNEESDREADMEELGPMDAELDPNSQSRGPWLTDEESMESSIQRFTHVSRIGSQLPDEHGRHRLDERASASPSDGSHSPKSDTLTGAYSSPRVEDHSHPTLDSPLSPRRPQQQRDSASSPDDEDYEEGGGGGGGDTAISNNQWQEETETETSDVENLTRTGVSPNVDQYADDIRAPTYMDEDTQFSLGESSSRRQPDGGGGGDLTDDLVAQDLQLTDSDDGDYSGLSDQGGQLCTDAEFSQLSSSEPSHRRLQSADTQRQHVAFFIGEEDEEEEDD